MRIVKANEFLRMPAGVVFNKFKPYIFEGLCIKGKSIEDWKGDPFDFFYSELGGLGVVDWSDTGDMIEKMGAAQEGHLLSMDFDTQSRDGIFNGNQLYAVWSRADITALIAKLETAVGEDEVSLTAGS